jgi:hypothetical protein
MQWRFDCWNRTPKSPVVAIHSGRGLQFAIGPLDGGRRTVALVTAQRKGFWRTRREARPIGYWDTASGEFVSTDALLQRRVFMSAREVIVDLELANEGAAQGTVDLCPVCSVTRAASGITREIGVTIRFFEKQPPKKETE